jgi:hypothetical protein
MISIVLTGLLLATAPVPLADWHADHLSAQRTGMWVLGGWAVANIGMGAAGWATASEARTRSFHLGNLAWNTVNLALAGMGLWNALKGVDAVPDPRTLLQASEFQEKLFFVNAALDVAYVAAAAFLWQRGDARGDAQLVGFGQALALQGAFLLLFDTAMGIWNVRLTHALFDRISISPLGVTGTF